MGTLDPRKLIEININHTNNFHMKISRITVFLELSVISVVYKMQQPRGCTHHTPSPYMDKFP